METAGTSAAPSASRRGPGARRAAGTAAGTGEDGPAAGTVTIREVASAAGVSKAAVSKALNGRPGVSEETRERILGIAARLGWRPNSTAAALAHGRTRTVGMVLNRPSDLLSADPFFPELLSGVERVLAPLDYSLTLRIGAAATPDDEREMYRRLAVEHRVAGVLLTDPRLDDARFGVVRDLALPAVLISQPWPEGARDRPAGLPPCVEERDPSGGVADVVRHFAAGGHRRVGYVHGPVQLAHVAQRLGVFRDTARALGLEVTALHEADYTAPSGAAATARLARDPRRPTAILYDSDIMAIAGIQTLRAAGLDVPGDVSVAGHDDLPVSRWISPPLTTVCQDVQGRGERAALRLLRELGEPVDRPAPMPESVLVERDSTGPAPSRPDA